MVLDFDRKANLEADFAAAFGGRPQRWFSVPGRTEIGGNHTDHQRGRVLAGAVDLDMVAAARPNGTDTIRVLSQGYPLCVVDLAVMNPVPEETGTTAALIRGVAAGFAGLGCPVAGFDACCASGVLPGSGLSSSAAFEVLIGAVINGLFFDGRASAQQLAMVGQYAENVFFGKPCGLMDQMACALGGLVAIDFRQQDAPQIRQISLDLAAWGYALCIIDSGADHADLTDEYAAVPGELQAICAQFGAQVLTQVPEDAFYAAIPRLRQICGDRAVLRAIHVYQEDRRVAAQVAALERGDFAAFLELVKESGRSSWMYLQNVIPAGGKDRQEMAVALALCDRFLGGRGAFRVHGGGFAGTVQAFVPLDMLPDFRKNIHGALGDGACRVLSIRPQGACQVE